MVLQVIAVTDKDSVLHGGLILRLKKGQIDITGVIKCYAI